MKEAKNLITRILIRFADLIKAYSPEHRKYYDYDLYFFDEDEFSYRFYESRNQSKNILGVYKKDAENKGKLILKFEFTQNKFFPFEEEFDYFTKPKTKTAECGVVLRAEAGTTGYQGGNSGCNTYFKIENDESYSPANIQTKVNEHKDGFEVALVGDWELNAIIESLEFVLKTLKQKAEETKEGRSSISID